MFIFNFGAFFKLQLDRILQPNPFSKPRAVVILEVHGIKGLFLCHHLVFFVLSLEIFFLLIFCNLCADSLFDHDSILVDDDTWSTKIIGSKNAQVKLCG